ncbi:hypothetical protein TNCV_3348941 [Trichonephila clavipes]|nr:hypothetical protein TNCV_3348941 [Trichonephila clavipes]
MKVHEIHHIKELDFAPVVWCSFEYYAERLGWNVPTKYEFWKQWSRNRTDSRKPGTVWSLGTTEIENHRIRRAVVTHWTASVSDI